MMGHANQSWEHHHTHMEKGRSWHCMIACIDVLRIISAYLPPPLWLNIFKPAVFFPSVHPWPRIAFSSWLLLSDSSRTSCCDAHSVRSSNRPPPKILPSVPGVSMALSLPHRLIVNPSLHLSGLWSFIPFKLQLMMNGRTSLGLKPRSLCGIAR